MAWITDSQIWISFLTLAVLEIVLGVDNIVFISILAGKLPHEQRHKARQMGLSLALITRILLLLSITWVMGLTAPLFEVLHHKVSGRDLILLLGGLFLIYKAVTEIHDKLEGDEHFIHTPAAVSFGGVIGQILILDIVFSLDSVITAVGMASHVGVMIAAVIAAVGVMLFLAAPLSSFVEKHPTVKILALSFLVLIGVNLVAESFHQAIPKGYTYFAMGFAVGVEILNLRLRKKSEPVRLHEDSMPPDV
jgi:predicted tellurium resistance membrane protein TerC